MLEFASQVGPQALLIIATLLPIINPPGGAPIFLLLTQGAAPATRNFLARRVALNCGLLLLAAMFVGSYVLDYFGISTGVVRVAGGLLVTSFGWKTLQEAAHGSEGPGQTTEWSRQIAAERAFYPMTFPLTVGPGSTAVALTLGANLYHGGQRPIAAPVAALLAVLVLALAVYLCYRFADQIVRLLGDTGTKVLLRLAAFVLLCVGLEILWGGITELLDAYLARRTLVPQP